MPSNRPVMAEGLALGNAMAVGPDGRLVYPHLYGGEVWAVDLDGGAPYPIITGDYTGVPAWERKPIVAGTPVGKPSPIFTKLDPSVVDEELARLAD